MVKNRSVSHLFSSGSRNQAEQLINKRGRITLIRGSGGRILATRTLRTITNSPKSRHVSTWSGQLDAAVSGQREMSLRRKKTRLQKWEGERAQRRQWRRPHPQWHHSLAPRVAQEPQVPSLGVGLQLCPGEEEMADLPLLSGLLLWVRHKG